MGCRCNERRTAIIKAAGDVRQGDVKAATEKVRFVTRTAIEDARSFAGRITTARQKLARR